MTEEVKVAMEVVGTGAEEEVLGQIDITLVETVHAHTERLSASSILCTKNCGLRVVVVLHSRGCS